MHRVSAYNLAVGGLSVAGAAAQGRPQPLGREGKEKKDLTAEELEARRKKRAEARKRRKARKAAGGGDAAPEGGAIPP